MRNSIQNIKKSAIVTVVASLALATIGSNAFAASNLEECSNEISLAEQMMLTANITNDQLASIDADLQAANTLCANGDFVGATAKIEANIAIMKASAN